MTPRPSAPASRRQADFARGTVGHQPAEGNKGIPMNALTLTLIRLAFLAVLWLFVIAAVGVVRTDLFGTASSSSRRQARRQRAPRPPQPPKPARPPKPSRSPRSAPQQLLVTAGALAGTTLGLADQQITIGRAN